MNRRPLHAGLIALLIGIGAATAFAADDDAGFKPIFDGKTLEGWAAPDMSYWSVEDGAITAQSSAEHPCTKNQFLVWKLGELDDFELRFKYRISGDKSANSGAQIRSAIAEDGHAVGYQADIDLGGQWAGALYDEHTPRTMLASRGQRTTIDEKGERKVEALGDPAELMPRPDADGWNEYRITARGTHLTLSINGKVTSEVIDNQPEQRELRGKLALQLHSGPPAKVQFKDITLKRLSLAEVDAQARRKIVMVAGRPSHGKGEHEHNAGVKLLKKCLDDNAPQVLAVSYHDNGWPQDATAFDNADAIVLYMDGGDGHPVNQHLAEMDTLMSQGVGLMCMHYAVEVPAGASGDAFKKWIGGHYEHGWSINPHWDAKAVLNNKHPITHGVASFTLRDEWYFNMRFRDAMKGVTGVLEAVPDDEARSGSTSWPRGPKKHIVEASGRSEIILWAAEGSSADGGAGGERGAGRGVGFTGGHFHRNWADDNLRKLVLNAMLWVAGAEVPDTGVPSTVSDDDMKANLDPK